RHLLKALVVLSGLTHCLGSLGFVTLSGSRDSRFAGGLVDGVLVSSAIKGYTGLRHRSLMTAAAKRSRQDAGFGWCEVLPAGFMARSPVDAEIERRYRRCETKVVQHQWSNRMGDGLDEQIL